MKKTVSIWLMAPALIAREIDKICKLVGRWASASKLRGHNKSIDDVKWCGIEILGTGEVKADITTNPYFVDLLISNTGK